MTKVAEVRESGTERLQRAFEKTSKYFSLVVVPISATMTLVSPWLMELYGGAKYRDGWPILAILSLAQLAYYIGSLYGIFVYVLGRPKDLLFLNIAVGGSNVLFSFLLIGLIGKAGIAWSQLLAFVLMVVVAKRIISPIVALHFDTKVISVLSVPLLLGGGIILLGQLLYFRLWVVPVYVLVAGVLAILTIGSRLNDEDWTQIRALAPGRLSTAVDRSREVFKWRSKSALRIE
jgi:O-antigen/teichoic acid export membrane protein